MSIHNPNSNPRPDLGNYNGATDASSIDNSFKSLSATPRIPCIVCKQPSTHKLVPHSKVYATAEVEDKGFVCDYCTRHIDRNTYQLVRMV